MCDGWSHGPGRCISVERCLQRAGSGCQCQRRSFRLWLFALALELECFLLGLESPLLLRHDELDEGARSPTRSGGAYCSQVVQEEGGRPILVRDPTSVDVPVRGHQLGRQVQTADGDRELEGGMEHLCVHAHVCAEGI